MKAFASVVIQDMGILVLRLFFGFAMAAAHGWPKLQRFAELQAEFPDPLGIGNSNSLVLVILAELVCASAVALGCFFRISLVPLIATMFVAAFVIHGQDPFKKQELAFAYLAAYTALMFCGPGRFSIDFLRNRKTLTQA